MAFDRRCLIGASDDTTTFADCWFFCFDSHWKYDRKKRVCHIKKISPIAIWNAKKHQRMLVSWGRTECDRVWRNNKTEGKWITPAMKMWSSDVFCFFLWFIFYYFFLGSFLYNTKNIYLFISIIFFFGWFLSLLSLFCLHLFAFFYLMNNE